jgi:hypothetical protein
VFSRREKLRHTVVDFFAAAGPGIDQGEASQPLIDSDQQWMEACYAPITVQVRKLRKATPIAELHVV